MTMIKIKEAMEQDFGASKFGKLPKWAQQEMITLTMRREETEKRLALFTENTASSMWHGNSYSTPGNIYIPNHDIVTFKVGEGRNEEIRVTLQKDSLDNHNYLYVSSADRAIIIEPAGGVNCAKIYVKTLLTNQ